MKLEPAISIVIPTLERGRILLKTVELLQSSGAAGIEILVVDQTKDHPPEVEKRLGDLHAAGQIHWIRRSIPSITSAMNYGLQQASSDLVLFLDDDIEPTSDLVQQHRHAFVSDESLWASVGQVVQPWQTPDKQPPRAGRLHGLRKDMDFRFNSTVDSDVENTMAGNLCVDRCRVLSIGGFDQNFLGSAIQFETDFARRIIRAGGRIRFLGSAGLNHLAAGSGGTRARGGHLTCGNAMHSVGGYYYAFRNAPQAEAWWYCLQRMARQVRTRFHLTHPWWIPVKLTGEVRALCLAHKLFRQGPRLLPTISGVPSKEASQKADL